MAVNLSISRVYTINNTTLSSLLSSSGVSLCGGMGCSAVTSSDEWVPLSGWVTMMGSERFSSESDMLKYMVPYQYAYN